MSVSGERTEIDKCKKKLSWKSVGREEKAAHDMVAQLGAGAQVCFVLFSSVLKHEYVLYNWSPYFPNLLFQKSHDDRAGITHLLLLLLLKFAQVPRTSGLTFPLLKNRRR